MSTEYQIVAQGDVSLIHLNGTPYADSRMMAKALDNEHRYVVRLISDNLTDFEQLGHVRFENATVTNSVGAANKQKYVLLNENQCYLLLTYSRNSEVTRPLKIALIKEFGRLRDLAIQEQKPVSELDLLGQMLNTFREQNVRLELLEGSQVELEARLDDQPISAHADKRNHIQKLIQELGNVKGGRAHVGLAYNRYKAHFGLPGKFDALKACQYSEAVALLTRWIAEAHKDDGCIRFN